MKAMRRVIAYGQSALLLVMLSTLLLATGCSAMDPYRGPGFRDDESTVGKLFRPVTPENQRYFFNEKSREIERSLGYTSN